MTDVSGADPQEHPATEVPAPLVAGDVPPLRVVALVKQIPVFEEMRLGPDGRLQREGLPLEMSAYCRRAVAQGVAVAAATGGTCTVVTLGPPSAEDVLREAVAFGADGGVLVTDPAFAGSDTLATSRALTAALALLEQEQGGAFDLILVGRNSVDADTGQVGPQVAQLLDRPFATGVKHLALRPPRPAGARGAGADGRDPAGPSPVVADVGLEHDDLWLEATVALPAVLSTAERLIDPCKIKDPAVWATVAADRIRLLAAADLGPGPWGAAASPTWVGEIRAEQVDRAGIRLEGPLDQQVRAAVAVLADRGALHAGDLHAELDEVVPAPARTGADPATGDPAAGDDRRPTVAVVLEDDRPRLARELLTAAARLAAELGGRVVAVGVPAALARPEELASWGADALVRIDGAEVEEDVAEGVVGWLDRAADSPWALLVGSTAWGREVAGRVAAALGAGLTGDAVGFAVDPGPASVHEPDAQPDAQTDARPDGAGSSPVAGPRLVAWKPAFGGSLVAAIRARSLVQLATVRSGVLGTYRPRVPARALPVEAVVVEPRHRVVVRRRVREDDLGALAQADIVVGVGQGVDPAHYDELDGLLAVLGAELAATRKVTDGGWLPRARQLGITGLSISPRLYVAIGTSGKFNHMVGVRSAGTILAVNPDPASPLFDVSDVGIVGDWRAVVPALVAELTATQAARPAATPAPGPVATTVVTDLDPATTEVPPP